MRCARISVSGEAKNKTKPAPPLNPTSTANMRKVRAEKAADKVTELCKTAQRHRRPGNDGNDELDREQALEYMKMVEVLNRYPWYHGMMPREDCEDLLKRSGDFALRFTIVNGLPVYCISLCWEHKILHVPITRRNDMWVLKGAEFRSVAVLVLTHQSNRIKLNKDGAELKNPIPRPPWCLLHTDIVIHQQLGAGAFGEVCRGKLIRRDKANVDCAVKKLRMAVSKNRLREFIKEAKTMMKFDHPNVVRVYGVATQEDPMMIVLELAPCGQLRSYFRKRGASVTPEQMLQFSVDACRGMCYLSTRDVIHRDLAARNCLLGAKTEVKISDFGMSVQAKELRVEKLEKMPVRWLAPEVIRQGLFSVKSDVWAYGVLLWEIYTYCEKEPFPGVPANKLRDIIVSGKSPMEAPAKAQPVVMIAMAKCFTQSHEERADFVQLLRDLSPNEKPPIPPSQLQPV